MKYRPKHIVEYVLLRIISGLVNLLPYRGALAVGWMLAGFAFYVCQFRRSETIRRMRSVFGDRFSTPEYHRMAWTCCRNLMFHVIEILRSKKTTLEWCNQHFEYAETIKTLKQQVASGTGAVIATSHTGNWDLGAFAIAQNEIPLLVVVAKQRNPLVNAYFDRIRSAPFMTSLTRGKPGVLKGIVTHLRNGNMLGIVPDARMKTPDLEMPFLGGNANLGAGMASFARMVGVPIILVIVDRIGWTKHRIRIFQKVEPNLTLDKQTDIHRMTAIVLDHINREIRTAPEQWFWYNKRWILDPVKQDLKRTEQELS